MSVTYSQFQQLYQYEDRGSEIRISDRKKQFRVKFDHKLTWNHIWI